MLTVMDYESTLILILTVHFKGTVLQSTLQQIHLCDDWVTLVKSSLDLLLG